MVFIKFLLTPFKGWWCGSINGLWHSVSLARWVPCWISPTTLIFYQGHKLHDNRTNLRFVFKEKKSCYPCTIINKGDKPSSPWNIKNITGILLVCMNKIKGRSTDFINHRIRYTFVVCQLTHLTMKTLDLNFWTTKETITL